MQVEGTSLTPKKTLPGGRHHLLLQAWQTAGLPQQALNTQEKEEKRRERQYYP